MTFNCKHDLDIGRCSVVHKKANSTIYCASHWNTVHDGTRLYFRPVSVTRHCWQSQHKAPRLRNKCTDHSVIDKGNVDLYSV